MNPSAVPADANVDADGFRLDAVGSITHSQFLTGKYGDQLEYLAGLGDAMGTVEILIPPASYSLGVLVQHFDHRLDRRTEADVLNMLEAMDPRVVAAVGKHQMADIDTFHGDLLHREVTLTSADLAAWLQARYDAANQPMDGTGFGHGTSSQLGTTWGPVLAEMPAGFQIPGMGGNTVAGLVQHTDLDSVLLSGDGRFVWVDQFRNQMVPASCRNEWGVYPNDVRTALWVPQMVASAADRQFLASRLSNSGWGAWTAPESFAESLGNAVALTTDGQHQLRETLVKALVRSYQSDRITDLAREAVHGLGRYERADAAWLLAHAVVDAGDPLYATTLADANSDRAVRVSPDLDALLGTATHILSLQPKVHL